MAQNQSRRNPRPRLNQKDWVDCTHQSKVPGTTWKVLTNLFISKGLAPHHFHAEGWVVVLETEDPYPPEAHQMLLGGTLVWVVRHKETLYVEMEEVGRPRIYRKNTAGCPDQNCTDFSTETYLSVWADLKS